MRKQKVAAEAKNYKPGFELVGVSGSFKPSGFNTIDFNESIATGFATHPLHVNKVIINNAVPRHWKIKFDAKKLEVDSVVHMLSSEVTLKGTIDALRSLDFINRFFESATNAKSGLFYTDTALLSPNLILAKVGETLVDHGISHDSGTTLVLAALLMDVLNELGIVAYSGSSIALVTKTRLFANYDDIVTELRKAKISYIISKIDKTRIKTTSKMGVGVLAQVVHSAMNEVAIELTRLKTIEQELDTLLCLLRAYATKDFSLYTQDELGIFQENEFLDLSSNFTLTSIALSHGERNRPASGAFYWSQVLARVNLALRSSTAISIVELSAIKEYFTLSKIVDQVGFKRGVVFTKNYKDATPFEPYFVTGSGTGYIQVVKDTAAEMAMSGLVGQLKQVDSNTLHTYYKRMFALMTTNEVDHYVYTSFITEEDAAHFAVAYAGGVELGSYSLGENLFYRTLVYNIATRNSRVFENASNFGLAKYINPLAVLFFGEEDDFTGKRVLSYTDTLLSETDKVSYSGLREISTDKIGRKIVMDLVVGTTKARTDWKLDDLLGTPGLDETLMVRPVIGEALITRLVESYNELAKLASGIFGMSNDFKLTLALQFAKIIEPMFLSQDVAQITTSAISRLWHSLASSDETKGSLKYVKASFYDARFKAEMKFRAALFFAFVTGFITDGKQIKEIVDAWNDAGGFNHI